MNIRPIAKKWMPSIVAFILVAGGILAALPSDTKSAQATDLVPVLYTTSRLDEGTPSANVKDNVEVRRIPANVRTPGALSSPQQIPAGVLASNHVSGQQLLETSFAANRATAVGEGYAAVSVKLDAQRWVGPVQVAGKFVSVYSIINGQSVLICSDAVVLDAPSTNDVKATDDSIISLGVRREVLGDVVAAAEEDHLWLTGR